MQKMSWSPQVTSYQIILPKNVYSIGNLLRLSKAKENHSKK
ncbi:hypothetical protein M917_0609 [Psychrobacter aquaticus CMS 56]|uniref:Uncharacterized protein n=1 Tax=Psychrobacter aquaticus CMS 56 TaxID=1354303 RepID=U4TDR2_9GAMM|nr:hypothetical protein M917_0609 [Psychrobacter aquaticus CMS 56]